MVRLEKNKLKFFIKSGLVTIIFLLFIVNSYSQDRIYNYYCEKYDTKSSSINYYDKEGAIIHNVDSIEFLNLAFYEPKDLYRLKLLSQCTNLKCLVLDSEIDTLIIGPNLLNSKYLHCLFINGWYLKYLLIDSFNAFDSIYNFACISYNTIDLQFIFKYLKNVKALSITSAKRIDLGGIDNLKDLEIIEMRFLDKIVFMKKVYYTKRFHNTKKKCRVSADIYNLTNLQEIYFYHRIKGKLMLDKFPNLKTLVIYERIGKYKNELTKCDNLDYLSIKKGILTNKRRIARKLPNIKKIEYHKY